MITRIERSIEKFGERFLERVFTPEERAYAERLPGAARMGCYAKRWAAKEACTKALGTGVAQGVQLGDIGVLNGENGAPVLALTGGARMALERLIPHGKDAEIFVSLTDDPPFALAQVLIQAVELRSESEVSP